MNLSDPLGNGADMAATGFVRCADEDDVARHLLRPSFSSDGETVQLLAFDGHARLISAERIEATLSGRCAIPPMRWRRLLGPAVTGVLMAHNHPSGVVWPSEGDLACTRAVSRLLRPMGIDLFDHLIFVDSGHFSFRRAHLL
jgi:DNA repair protein RadC